MSSINFSKIDHIKTEHGVSRPQAEELYQLAKQTDKPILEIGAYLGRSTACLALGSQDGHKVPVITVDPFTAHEGSFETFKENMEKAGVWDLIDVRKTTSDKVMIDGEIGLLFIDGSHEYKWASHDFIKFHPIVNGWICMHDFHFEGVKRVFDEYIYPNLREYNSFKLIKNMIVYDISK